jgi:protein-disulfide isomerase
VKQTHAVRVALPGRRRRGLWLIAAVLTLAAVVAVVLIVVSRGGSSAPARVQSVAGAPETAALLAGLPQHGNALGSPQAPLTLVEYGDLQCPICARWTTDALPTIVRDYVRPGKVRLVFRGLGFLGSDSEKALRTALAAAPSGKLWNVVDLLYRNQGAENSGWVSDGLLRGVLASASLDADAILAQRSSDTVTAEMAAARLAATNDRVPGTPTFMLGPTGGELSTVRLTTLDPRQLASVIDATLP